VFHDKLRSGVPKAELYKDVVSSLDGLLTGETDHIANLANAAALLWLALLDINWVGFYLSDGEGGLVLGPFQGRPACTRIAAGRGVCGAAAARRQTVVVPDVHAFPGHIACDSASRSEIVLPLLAADGSVYGVLDVDSPKLARFDEADAAGLADCVAVLRRHLGLLSGHTSVGQG
jgi:GAF domain-containing protein